MGVVEFQSWRPATALNERLSSRETVVGYSVGDLTAIRMGVLGDPWRLSLVQRAAVWNELQVAYLLDSLVWGYPIGLIEEGFGVGVSIMADDIVAGVYTGCVLHLVHWAMRR